jgi:hypothetical protein
VKNGLFFPLFFTDLPDFLGTLSFCLSMICYKKCNAKVANILKE